MATHYVKCRVCGERFDTTPLKEGVDFIRAGKTLRSYYHKTCWEIFQNPSAVVDVNDASLWLDRICDFLGRERKVDYNYFLISKQLENYIKAGRTGKGVYFAVRYMFEKLNSDWSKSRGGIGLVDFIYDESANYWSHEIGKVNDITAQLKTQKEIFNNREEKVVIKKKDFNPRRKIKEIDFSDILNGEDEE